MKTTSPVTPDSPIHVPEIDSDVPVAVIPVASVAPLDGDPDGERINSFTLQPRKSRFGGMGSAGDLVDELRGRVTGKPLMYAVGAFSIGFVLSRLFR